MKTNMPWFEAWSIAEKRVAELEPYCKRIVVAGSLRRQKTTVGDIEVVAVPHAVKDMFGQEAPNTNQLNQLDYSTMGRVVLNGPKQKKIELDEDISLDLFITTPQQWGWILLLRTGPKEYGKRLVTPKTFGGLLPSWLHMKDGYIYRHGRPVEVLEEEDVYKLFDLPYVQPWERQ